MSGWPKGGLVSVNLASHNEALLIKFLHKFFIKENIPWVHLIWKSYNNSTPQASNISSSFWWRDIVKLRFVQSPRGLPHAQLVLVTVHSFGATIGLRMSS
jgi:hypothetical protein